ncbi:Fc receptor-like protein 5 [Sebastes fasciatus]|uniref:Fc receptor-like protein 5 n=1 Tax=Sebastes fasciatus TaxID=394691 RepID=UPI003D9EC446
MEITTLCAVVATLRVLPNRSQFFQYESISLRCEQRGMSSEWRVKKNTSIYINEECLISWERTHESHCFIDDLYPSDTGVYWCESVAGECSDAVSITVNAGSVILESPVLPVMEGDDVTLSCRTKTTSSNLTADFYKDGLLIGSSSTGNMTIHSVSWSDEGLYKCDVSGVGGSPESWLTVRGSPNPPDSPVLCILLPAVGACLLLVSVMLLCLRGSHKGQMDLSVVLYTDVTSTWKSNQKSEPLRRDSMLLYTVAVYRRVNKPSRVLIYKA